jgi:hypothetical protein
MRRPTATRHALRFAALAGVVSLTACGTSSSDSASDTAVTASTAPTDDSAADSTAADAAATVAAEGVEITADAAAMIESAGGAWDANTEATITLADGSSTSDAPSVEIEVDGDTGADEVTITEAGTYRISGSLADGRLRVDLDDETTDGGLVRLVLDGVDFSSSTGSAIEIDDAGQVIVWLAGGSQNTLADATSYAVDDDAAATTDESEQPVATVSSKVPLSIAGDGTLSVTGNANDAISSKDGLVVVGGSLELVAADDGLRGKDFVVVSGGTLQIAVGDDALHADEQLSVSGGQIDVEEAYEGLESKIILISGGEISLVTSDDGINIAGGNDGSGQQGPGGGRGPGGQDTFAVSSDQYAEISGGSIWIDADGDGFDVNGSTTVTGGTIEIAGPTADNNGALDVDGAFTVANAVVIAAGSSGMAMAPDSGDGQGTLALRFGGALPEGTTVEITDSTGAAILTFGATKPFASLVYSSPDLEPGSSYLVAVDGTEAGTVTAG